jgi:hypothetical protein
MGALAPRDLPAVEKPAVEEQALDDVGPDVGDKLVHQVVQDRALVLVAGHQPHRHPQAEAALAVGMEEGHELVAAPERTFRRRRGGHPGELVGLDGMPVRVKAQADRTLVLGIVGDEDVAGVADEEALAVEGVVLLEHARHVAIEPPRQQLGAGALGERAQEVLIAGRLALVVRSSR